MEHPTTPERLRQLNQEFAETKNLTDSLAVDFHLITAAVVPGFKLDPFPAIFGIVKKMEFTSQALYAHGKFDLFPLLSAHRSDIMRGLACYLLALHDLSLQEKLELVMPLARDSHYAVREWSWLALRPAVIERLPLALELLTAWSYDADANIRRFASEMTRPRGVWCRHIFQLRAEPWQALPLLEPLKADPARYVQLSVGNWLNDAVKDHPTWVTGLCQRWLDESPVAATQKICKRGVRSMLRRATIS